jgi:hypothetical protein
VNTGTVAGKTTVSLVINGNTIRTEEVSLDAGGSTTLSWKTSSEWSVGTYNVEIEGLIGSFTINESESPTDHSWSLSLIASPSSFSIGGSTELSGYLRPEIEDMNVSIFYRRQGDSWYNLDLVSTWNDGSYLSYWTPGSPGEYEVIAAFQLGSASDPVYSPIVQVSVEEDRCLIATVAYGSELNEKVQFLRMFREKVIYSSTAGSHFMKGFNSIYYSFSPSVAKKIGNNYTLCTIIRIILYPLIIVLQIASKVYSFFSFNNEFGVIITGFAASSLIGLVYFTPLTLTGIIMASNNRLLIERAIFSNLKKVIMLFIFSLFFLFTGILFSNATVVMVSSVGFITLNVIISASTSSIFFYKFIRQD